MSNRPLQPRNDSLDASLDSDIHLELAGHRIQPTNSNSRQPTSQRRPPPAPAVASESKLNGDLQQQRLDELNQEWQQLGATPVPSNSTNDDSSSHHPHLHISATSTTRTHHKGERESTSHTTVTTRQTNHERPTSTHIRGRRSNDRTRTPSPATRTTTTQPTAAVPSDHHPHVRTPSRSPSTSSSRTGSITRSPLPRSNNATYATHGPIVVRSNEERFEKWKEGVEKLIPPPPAAAPSSLAKSLTTLHRKVRAHHGQKPEQSAAPIQPTHPSRPLSHPSNPQAFDRLYHGLPAFDPNAPPPLKSSAHPLRTSLEELEAAFLTRLAESIAPPTSSSAAAPSNALTAGPASTKASPARPSSRSTKLPRSSPAPTSHFSTPPSLSAVALEEEQIRQRAQQLQADLAALAQKKHATLLAESAAQLRIQMRQQLEARESDLRQQLAGRVQEVKHTREMVLSGCKKLQEELAAKMVALQQMQLNVTHRIEEVESTYAQTMSSLQHDFSASMDQLYEAATQEMEQKLHQLTHPTTRRDESAISTQPPERSIYDTPYGPAATSER